MIVVTGVFTVAPEDREAFLEAAKPGMVRSRAEDGCEPPAERDVPRPVVSAPAYRIGPTTGEPDSQGGSRNEA